MQGKKPSQSRVEMTQIVMPSHLNHRGSLFGGQVVQWMDICSAVAAMRHSGRNAVTASIDGLHFMSSVALGDVVILQAQVNYTRRTSMEIGCRVDAEDHNGNRRYTTKAYLTFVSLDDDGKPCPVPPVEPQTDDEHRRFGDAEHRWQLRLDSVQQRRSNLPPS